MATSKKKPDPDPQLAQLVELARGPGVQVPLDDLRDPPGRNPNQMPVGEFESLVRAIAEYGFLQPCLARRVAGGIEIIDGIHRSLAARRAGLTSVACVVLPSCTDEQARLLRIAMNRLRGALDYGVVTDEFRWLSEQGVGLELLTMTGFDAGEIQALLDSTLGAQLENGPAPTPDDTPAPRRYAVKVELASREQRDRAIDQLLRLGGGDAAQGLLVALERAGGGA